jgi:hypothetical protein
MARKRSIIVRKMIRRWEDNFAAFGQDSAAIRRGFTFDVPFAFTISDRETIPITATPLRYTSNLMDRSHA